MTKMARNALGVIPFTMLASLPLRAEILAMANYESKPEMTPRREGIAVIDVDPGSKNFNKLINDIPLPPESVAHHIFYNKDMSKACVTNLGRSVLYLFDMKQFPSGMKVTAVRDCRAGEDLVFSEDRKTWFLTCMRSDNVIVGNALTVNHTR